MNGDFQRSGGIAVTHRSDFLDSLRGLALFGILLVNMSYFSGWWDSSAEIRLHQTGNGAAMTVAFILEWLFAGKFYSLFSLLFGVGFSIQLQRLESSGSSLRLYVRRLTILFVFGLAHMLLLWMGDILALYAMLGLVLLAFRSATDAQLLIAALIFALMPIIWAAAIAFGGWHPTAPLSQTGSDILAAFGLPLSGPVAIWSNPSCLVHLKAHLAEPFFNYSNLIYELRPSKILSMFLVGYWTGRRLVGLELAIPGPTLKRALLIGMSVGLPLGAFAAWTAVKQFGGLTSAEEFAGEAASTIATPALALAYASGFALLWRSGGAAMLSGAGPAGRMALTNYLLQSMIQCVIFFGWGFGLVGAMSITFVPPLAAVVFTGQLVFSNLWLRQFRWGPFEWLWRSLTLGHLLPMRKQISANAA